MCCEELFRTIQKEWDKWDKCKYQENWTKAINLIVSVLYNDGNRDNIEEELKEAVRLLQETIKE